MAFDPSQHPRGTAGQFAPKLGTAAEVSLLSELPVLRKRELSHVGTLDPSAKKSHSYEGQGLSVSQNPEEWQRIARLSGDVHRFDREAQLLDFHALSESQRLDIATYAQERGWVEPADTYVVSYYDDEWESEMTMRFTDREEAEDEAAALEADEPTVESGFVYVQMPDSTARAGEEADLGVVAAAWVGEQRPDLDGVWWDDDLDVSRLSAPRGVIVPQRIDAWLSAYSRA